MESINRKRKAQRQIVAKVGSVSPAAPLMFTLQKQADVAALLAYPEKRLDAIQNTDATDPNVGKFNFMQDYSAWGGPDPWP